jgi:hypothetical protein
MLEYRLPRILNPHSNDPSWMRSLKQWCNEVTRILRILRQLQGDRVNIVIDDNVIRFVGNASPVGSFRESRGGTIGESLTVSDGWIHIHGIGHYYVGATDLTLAGGPFVFVYLWALTTDYSTNGIAFSNGATVEDIPVSGSGRMIVVLWEYELNMATGVYGNSIARYGGQDFHAMTPVRN